MNSHGTHGIHGPLTTLINEKERKRRGANALALIRGEYDWKEIARRYTEVCKHVIR